MKEVIRTAKDFKSLYRARKGVIAYVEGKLARGEEVHSSLIKYVNNDKWEVEIDSVFIKSMGNRKSSDLSTR